MLTASRSITLSENQGEALPQVGALRDLYAHGNQFYRGGLHMIAGQPAAMKSMFALWLVEQMGLETVYFSADSDATTQNSRLIAMYTGTPAAQVREELEDDLARSHYAEIVGESKISPVYTSDPDIASIEAELSAYVELYDRFPKVIVLDNLLDLYNAGESETRGMKDGLLEMKRIARDTGAAVLVLHHVKEGQSEPGKPGSLKAIQGMVGQTPSMVLSVAREGDQFKMAPVKDRNGNDDKSGDTFFTIKVDGSTCRFEYQQPLAMPVSQEEKWW